MLPLRANGFGLSIILTDPRFIHGYPMTKSSSSCSNSISLGRSCRVSFWKRTWNPACRHLKHVQFDRKAMVKAFYNYKPCCDKKSNTVRSMILGETESPIRAKHNIDQDISYERQL